MPDPTVTLAKDGKAISVTPAQAASLVQEGWQPETGEQRESREAQERFNARTSGVSHAIGAATSAFASGATLGLSDAAIRAIGGEGAASALAEARAAHPYLSTGAMIAGGLAPIGSPAGYLASKASEGVEAARALGSVGGFARVVAISGAEGAAQNAGMYLSDVALGNRDLSIEGAAGALGRGFAFGSVAGGATYGLEKGTIAARRMFARTADGGADAAANASTAFKRSLDDVLQAHDDTAAIAQQKLDAIRQARAEAEATKASANTELARAKLDQFNTPATTPETPVDTTAPDTTASAPQQPVAIKRGIPSNQGRYSVAQPATEAETAATTAAPSPLPQALSGPAPSQAPYLPTPEEIAQNGWSAYPDAFKYLREQAGVTPPASLEDQLAETQQRLANGESLQDLNAQATTPADPQALAAQEQNLSTKLEDYATRRAKVDEWVAKIKNPRVTYDIDPIAPEAIGEGQMPMIRGRRTEALPEDVFVEQSGGNLRTIGKGEYNLEDITPNSRIVARSNGSDFTEGTKLDEAYQDAIERASRAETAPDREAALHEAADIEQQIHQYVRTTKPENAAVIDQIGKVRAEAGRTGYHAAFARAERLSEQESAIPATLAKGEPPSELAYLNKLRDKEASEPLNLDWYSPQGGSKTGTLDDINEAAAILGPYEKSAADLVEAVGPEAPPVAQEHAVAVRQAEDDANRKMIDRTTRAIDDHVQNAPEKFGPAEQYGPSMAESAGPRRGTPAERIEGAKAVKLETNAKLAKLREDEMGAKSDLEKAREAKADAQKAAKTISPLKPGKVVVAHRSSAFSKLEKLGEALEIAHMAGVPGLPSPESIPVIGPILGRFLRWRAFGRILGRVPATAETRIATLSASTRNKAAGLMDKILGVAEKAAPAARNVAVRAGGRAAEALSERIIDDGQPNAPKGASMQQQAAVRIRELAAATADPGSVIKQVREQLKDVNDPDILAAAEQFQLRKLAYLQQNAPQAPIPAPLNTKPWVPSGADALAMARRFEVADNPLVALEQIQNGTITPEGADAFRNIYPNMADDLLQRLYQRAATAQVNMPYNQRVRIGVLFNVPLDRLSEPETIASLHTAPATTSPAAPTQNAPATPSVAAPVKLADLYETASDRRAARR